MVIVFTEFLGSKWASITCLAVVVLALVLPPQGFEFPGGKPVPMCQFKTVTHLPCPGCGLTRSFIGMAHLDAARAARFHPLGLVLFPLTLFVASLLGVPDSRRKRLTAWIEARPVPFSVALWTLLAVFILYGFG